MTSSVDPAVDLVDDDDECPALISAKVPVTILTGFLGSGKTTLLHYVLTAEHQLRIAVIVNEFEFGKTIEKGLTLKSSQKPDDEWLELNNGCMCCTAQTQTVTALEDLIRRKGTFDLILVETAGLADPGPVAAMFWQDEALCGNLFLSGVVTVVDSVNIGRYLQDKDVQREAARQILIADKILLNKCDLVSASEREAAKALVTSLNPAAEIKETQFSQVPNLREILFMNTTRSLPDTLSTHLHGPAANGSCDDPGHHSVNRTSITAVPMEFQDSTGNAVLALSSVKDIDEICKQLLYPPDDETTGDKPFDVIRAKAALWVREHHATLQPAMGCTTSQEEPQGYTLYQLQCIGELFDVIKMEGQSVPFGCSRVLVLGRNLSEGKLRSIFSQYLVPSP